MTTDLLLERWYELLLSLEGHSEREIEVVRLGFYLGARAALDAAIQTPAGSRDIRLVLMRSELRDWHRGIKRAAA